MLRKDAKKHQENNDKVHLHLSLHNACLREEQHKTCQKERQSNLNQQAMPARKRRMRCSSLIHCMLLLVATRCASDLMLMDVMLVLANMCQIIRRSL